MYRDLIKIKKDLLNKLTALLELSLSLTWWTFIGCTSQCYHKISLATNGGWIVGDASY